MIGTRELECFMKNGRILVDGTPEKQAELVMKATAFDAILNEDADTLVKMTVNVADLIADTEKKVDLYEFALEAAKSNGAYFLEVCYNIAARIEKLKPDQAMAVFNLLSDQKEFKKIMTAAGIGYKKAKRGRPAKKDPLEDVYNEWQFPDSSSIRKYRYDPESCNLYVQFTSGDKLYTYVNVPKYKFADFHNADSKGNYFGKNIKFQHSINYTMKD